MRFGRSKYNARKTVIDGIRFDSAKEAQRYAELALLEKCGKITALRRQVKFVLIPAQYEEYERYSKAGKRLKNGRKCLEKECAYIADFVYDEDGRTVVEDVKGVRTDAYVIKRKLMLHALGIRVKEV